MRWYIFNIKCYSCHELTKVAYANEIIWRKNIDDKTIEILKEHNIILEFRNSKTLKEPYFANICNNCKRLQGDWYLLHDWLDMINIGYIPEFIEINTITLPFAICHICKKEDKNEQFKFVPHHISYFPEKTICVCTECHNKIHQTDEFPQFKPLSNDSHKFYGDIKAIK
jgi:hypothetical protein